MPIIREALVRQRRSRNRSLPFLGGRSTTAGVDVTPERALQISTVYACVRALSEDGSGLPVSLYTKTAGKRQRIEDHPVLPLITEDANPTLDAGEWWRMMFGWQGVRGNGLTFIERDRNARPVGLWPLNPATVDIRRNINAADPARRGMLIYHANPDRITDYAPLPDDGFIQPENMLHFRTFGLGLVGLSPITLARQQIGISYSAQEYIGGFFQRDASPGGVVSVEGNLTDTQFDRLSDQWKDLHEGVTNSHRLAVLEGGAKWEAVTLSPDDANFLEVMKFGRTEIASMYGVPPHRIGDLERATFSNIEQLSIDYVTYGLLPYLIRAERVARKLFGPGYYVKFDTKGLLRGDTAARYTAYTQGKQWGWLNTNDIRTEEDMDPVEGGDEYMVPLNMVPAAAQPIPRSTTGGRGALRARRSAGAVGEDEAMVGLFLPPDVAQELAVDGGLDAGDLHVTLAYLGTGLTADELDAARTVVSSIARQHLAPAGSIAGLGHFPDTGNGTPFYAPVDAAGLNDLRTRLVDQLTAAGVPVATDHGFNPHVTLSWVAAGEDPPEPVEVAFPQLCLAVGPDRSAFPFAGTRSSGR